MASQNDAEAAPRPASYSDDVDRLACAQRIIDSSRQFNKNALSVESVPVATSQAVAKIQVALREAYEQGLRMGAGRLDHPPMSLTLSWEVSRLGGMPVLTDDLGRRVPNIRSCSVACEVDDINRISLVLLCSDRIRIAPTEDPHGT